MGRKECCIKWTKFDIFSWREIFSLEVVAEEDG
jgi:hypothetical protein